MNLITAQIAFLEPQLTLIHIPINLYPFFLQPILRLLFGEDHDQDAASIAWTNRHEFLNITITSIECSIICARHLADRFIRPHSDALNSLISQSTGPDGKLRAEVELNSEDYIVIQVDGQGLDAGQRVLELTSPLAMAGISIFFITTYFSDYILVPSRKHQTVVQVLEQRGFIFSHMADAFVSQLSPSSPRLSHHNSYSSPFSPTSSIHSIENFIPQTPPSQDLQELQKRTFQKLKAKNIRPDINNGIHLFHCAGSREQDLTRDETLKNDLLQVFLATSFLPSRCWTDTKTTIIDQTQEIMAFGSAMPRSTLPHDYLSSQTPDFSTQFLSVTITANEPISILLEEKLLPHLGRALLGAKSELDALVPITLDLRSLPMHATGIVCGLAGKLAQASDTVGKEEKYDISPRGSISGQVDISAHRNGVGIRGASEDAGSIEISFLSTAKAGNVIVRASQLTQAMKALALGMQDTA